MWTKKLAAMLVAAVIIFFAATPAFAENNAEWYELYSKIEKNHGAYIENNTIFVIGSGMGPKGRNAYGSFYKSFARQAAKMDALRNLAETIKSRIYKRGGISIWDEFDDASLKYDENKDITIYTSKIGDKISLLLSKAKQFGEAKFDEHEVCEMIMQMPY